MPCDTVPAGQTKQQRAADVNKALTRLEQYLNTGKVTVKVGSNGALTFLGWSQTDRAYITDVCAYRKLLSKGSTDLRRAIARAEVQSGATINPSMIRAGVHSHDGGVTWGQH